MEWRSATWGACPAGEGAWLSFLRPALPLKALLCVKNSASLRQKGSAFHAADERLCGTEMMRGRQEKVEDLYSHFNGVGLPTLFA